MAFLLSGEGLQACQHVIRGEKCHFIADVCIDLFIQPPTKYCVFITAIAQIKNVSLERPRFEPWTSCIKPIRFTTVTIQP